MLQLLEGRHDHLRVMLQAAQRIIELQRQAVAVEPRVFAQQARHLCLQRGRMHFARQRA